MEGITTTVLVCVITFMSDWTMGFPRVKRAGSDSNEFCRRKETTFIQMDIPETYLETGRFYQLKPQHPFFSEMRLTSDFDVDYGNIILAVEKAFEVPSHLEPIYYMDFYWAFINSNEPGWYQFVNCGCTEILTEVEAFNETEFQLIMNSSGGPQTEQTLMKPVAVMENGNVVGYQLETKVNGVFYVDDIGYEEYAVIKLIERGALYDSNMDFTKFTIQ